MESRVFGSYGRKKDIRKLMSKYPNVIAVWTDLELKIIVVTESKDIISTMKLSHEVAELLDMSDPENQQVVNYKKDKLPLVRGEREDGLYVERLS